MWGKLDLTGKLAACAYRFSDFCVRDQEVPDKQISVMS